MEAGAPSRVRGGPGKLETAGSGPPELKPLEEQTWPAPRLQLGGPPWASDLQDSKTATPCPFGPLHLRPPSWQCGGGDAALDGARLPPLAVSPRAGGSPDDCAPRWTTDRPQTGRADTDAALTFPSVLSWKLSTRAASVHLAATSRAAFRRRSWGDGQGGGSAQGMSVRAQASRKCRPAAPAGSPPPPRLRACTDAPR